MAKIQISIPGERIVKEITALVPQVTQPTTARPPDIGLVEISQTQPTELIPGPMGPQGPRGSRWTTGTGTPLPTGGELLGDMYLNNTDDSIWQWNGSAWVDTGTKIHGSPDTGTDILGKLLPVDGAGSGLDADLLDAQHGAYYLDWANQTGKPTTFPPTLPIPSSGVTGLDAAQTTQDNRLSAVEAKNTSQDTAIAGKVGPDAPSDANAYGRKGGAWVDVAEDVANDGITYGRKNGAWVASVGGATIADVPPGPPLINGQLFWESDTGALYVWYNDGNSSQWVMVSGTGSSQQTDYVRKTGDTMSGALNGTSASFSGSLTSGGTVTAAQNFVSSVGYAVIAPTGAPNTILFRPQGAGNNTGATSIDGSGNMSVAGTLATGGALSVTGTATATGNVTGSNCISTAMNFIGSATGVVLGTAASSVGTLYLRSNGYNVAANQTLIDTGGNMTVNGNIVATGNISISGAGSIIVPSTGSVAIGTYSATGATAGKSLLTGTTQQSNTGSANTQTYIFVNANGGVGQISTSGTTTTYGTTSDERLKDFGADMTLDEAFAVINADPVRHFTWKTDGSEAIGWSAQKSYAISPDLAAPGVGEPGDEDFIPWAMEQGKRTPYLWAAVSGLLAKIDALEARLAALEAR